MSLNVLTPGACARILTMPLRLDGNSSIVSRVSCVVADVDLRGEADGEPDALPSYGLESWQRVLNGVGANRQGYEAILAALIAHRDDRRDLQGGPGHRHCRGAARPRFRPSPGR